MASTLKGLSTLARLMNRHGVSSRQFDPEPAMRAPLLIALLTAATVTQAALPARGLEAAVAAYERGELAAAHSAFTRLSRAGVPAADYNLAVMHLRGEVPAASPAQALQWMSRAADAGFVTAMVGLAQLHEQGRAGTRCSGRQRRRPSRNWDRALPRPWRRERRRSSRPMVPCRRAGR